MSIVARLTNQLEPWTRVLSRDGLRIGVPGVYQLVGEGSKSHTVGTKI